MVTQKRKSVVVTVSGQRPIREVGKDLSASGLHIDQVLENIGSITGHVHSEGLAKLRAVKGVTDVSEDQPVTIGPPDAPVS